ncbi:MAG: hypothetical protein EOM64_03480 [Erysipelotrichia bacterium]|nr:hypothetical protein [Erysipelotrichia bacterium]
MGEFKSFHIDQKEYQKLKDLGNYAVEVAGRATAGIAGGMAAGPALLVMVLISGTKMDKKLDKAIADKA